MKGGSLRVGAISPRWATGIVSHMVASYPLLDLDLTIANSKRLLDMVIESKLTSRSLAPTYRIRPVTCSSSLARKSS